MNDFLMGVSLVAHLSTFLWCAFGAVLGIILGALPGLTATMGIALVIPISYQLDTATGIGLLLAVYCGAVSGASIPAILLGIPGNPNAIATAEDGQLMTRKGLAGQALGGAVIASLIGGLGSELFLIFFSPLVAKMTLAFGPAEKCTMALVGLVIIAVVSGNNVLKGLLMGALGFVFAFLAPDPMSGSQRIPFKELLGQTPFANGLDLTATLIGLYGVSQVFVELANFKKPQSQSVCADIGNEIFPPFKKVLSMWKIILSSLGIGTLIGAVPGTGASIAVFMSRNAAAGICSRSKGKLEQPGTGCLEGVFAPEVANNAVTGGALIPALSLGIPGDAATAVLIGALMIKGVTPGFALFSQNMPLVYSIFITLLISNIFMAVFQLAGVRLYPKILLVSPKVLMPVVLILSFLGPYALAGSSISKGVYFLGTSLVMGLIGYAFKKNDYPIAPVVLGLILGGMFEEQFRRGVKLGAGTMSRFYTSPICWLFALLAVMIIVSTAIKNKKKENDHA